MKRENIIVSVKFLDMDIAEVIKEFPTLKNYLGPFYYDGSYRSEATAKINDEGKYILVEGTIAIKESLKEWGFNEGITGEVEKLYDKYPSGFKMEFRRIVKSTIHLTAKQSEELILGVPKTTKKPYDSVTYNILLYLLQNADYYNALETLSPEVVALKDVFKAFNTEVDNAVLRFIHKLYPRKESYIPIIAYICNRVEYADLASIIDLFGIFQYSVLELEDLYNQVIK